LRGVAQTISYEVRMTIILISALILNITYDFSLISNYIKSPIMLLAVPVIIMWFITNLAETNRTPFDFAEGESELVSGFNVEYRRGIFALIFIAEYANILVIRLFTACLFISALFNTLSILLILKALIISIFFVWVRATLPRIRYDFLISLTWKIFLPVSLSFLILIFSLRSIVA
jgi:NADH-ubiquinone oxidoreductase chain 1